MRRIGPAIVVTAAVLAGCTNGGDETSAPSVTPTTAASTTAHVDAPTAVPETLEFIAPAVGGGQLDARTFAGTPVAFWFWAPY